MGFSSLLFLAFASLTWPAASDRVPSTEFLYPNFTTSYYKSILSNGAFLTSPNGTYKAAIWSPEPQKTKYYLCIIHAGSNAVIWTANRDAPVSASGTVGLTAGGIFIADDDANVLWSTASLHEPQVSSLQLNEIGNLALLNKSGGVLWESYGHPTDTIVIGQVLSVGMSLTSARSKDDVSKGDLSLSLAGANAILQWRSRTYWKLSMDSRVFTNSNRAADHLRLNETGLYLFSNNGASVVIQLKLSPPAFRIAKLDYTGQFTIMSFSGTDPEVEFALPVDTCRIPNACGKLGLCTNGVQAYPPQCSCPANFHVISHGTADCVPVDAAYSVPRLCNSSGDATDVNSSLAVSYARLGYSVDYFSNDFTMPSKFGVNLSLCQDLCATDCTCFGVFYDNSSGSCFVLNNDVGSIFLRTMGENARLGYMKTVSVLPTSFGGDSDSGGRSLGFPLAGLVLLPFTGLSLFILLGFLLWRRSRSPLLNKVKYSRSYSGSSDDLEAFTIPGLPVRFEYEELEAATDKFKTQIGSGGFGDVYKGTLPDKVVVAVKRMNNLSSQGKKDFCTEIAIIGNIHHVNLVKLKGFCAQDRHRLLVYEYMDRGSLDKSLFGSAPVLEWQERVEVALGAARGLAYLHSSCDRKIIHCDIKPENILLQHNFHAKLSDFGLSKLLSAEQSTLFTTMRGTRGYLAPEWLTNSAISDKTDVYSFGMVLLEIVSGRKNCPMRSRSHSLDDSGSAGFGSSSSSATGLLYFPLFALEMHEQGRYSELADTRLEGRVTAEEVGKFVRIALCCVHEEPALRPSMVNVVSMLEGEITICEPRMESLNFLRFYGLRFAEASMVAGASTPDDETNNRAGSDTLYSIISSQQVSGPR